ncbi:MAG: hypothetical protein JWP74_1912 [Marmoricola sp.]|nr:hypothetical protein [Marmoricola sp.]
MQKSMKLTCVGVALATALTACGGTATAGKSSAKADPAKLADAKTLVASSLKNPDSIGITNPLSKTPTAGKTIIVVGTPSPVAELKDIAFADAIKKFGWTSKRLVVGAGPEDEAKTISQAVALKPDAILFSGAAPSTLAKPLAEAKAAGIPVLAETVTEAKSGPIFDASIDGPVFEQYAGKLMADYVAVKSGPNTNVAVVNLPVFNVLTIYTKAFTKELSSVCPSCKVTKLDQQLSDVGTNTPSSVVSALQRDPSIKWVIYSVGDLSTGVDTAVKAAGIKVSVGGGGANAANLAALKAGTEQAWTGLSTPILGYRDADMMARYFNGDPLTPGGDALLLPTQIMTPATIGGVALTSAGNYLGDAGYEQQFEKLWGLS